MQLENNNILNEEELFNLLNEYNSENINALKKLVLHNLKFINYITKKYEFSGINNEELISIGTIGFIKAINTFNINKGYKLATYSSRCIENEILMNIRKNKKIENKISVETIISIDENGQKSAIKNLLTDDRYNIEEHVIRNYENKIINDVVNELPDRDQEIIKLYFGFYNDVCYTEEEISKIYNISQSRISKIIRNNLPKIKQKYLERV